MTKPIPESLAEMKKGLVCLVPREGSKYSMTCHEKTLCDCQVLKLIEVVEVLTKACEHPWLAELDCECGYYGDDSEETGMSQCANCAIKHALIQAAKILEKKA